MINKKLMKQENFLAKMGNSFLETFPIRSAVGVDLKAKGSVGTVDQRMLGKVKFCRLGGGARRGEGIDRKFPFPVHLQQATLSSISNPLPLSLLGSSTTTHPPLSLFYYNPLLQYTFAFPSFTLIRLSGRCHAVIP